MSTANQQPTANQQHSANQQHTADQRSTVSSQQPATTLPVTHAPAADAPAADAPADQNPFVEFLRQYRNDPVGFVTRVLGQQPDHWQAEFLRAIASGKRRISIRSGHGVGKSTAASWAAEWYLLTRFPCKVVITAPTAAQLYDALFAELKAQFNRLPPALRDLFDITSDRIALRAAPESAFISARTSSRERPESLAGVHSENVLLIADEASGIPEEVFESAAGSMSGTNATTVLLGNPIRGQGFFYRTHTELSADWWCRRVSCLDSARVSPDFVRDMRARYGDQSNAFRTRVLGEFPTKDDDSLIDRALVESAMSRDVAVNPSAPIVWGLDVARFGSDSTVLCKRRGNVVLEQMKQYRGLDLMQVCGVVVAEINASSPDMRPAEICVDSIGLGSGVADRLRELGHPVRDVNVSESSAMNPQANRLRDDLWLQVKAWLEKRDCSLPKDEGLAADLTAPTYTFTSNGRIVVESKDSMRRRGQNSPDKADALCLTFAGQASLVGAGPGFRARTGPIRRNLTVV